MWTGVKWLSPLSPLRPARKSGHRFCMRKIRSLTELIAEAEEVLSDPVRSIMSHPELPKKPTPPNAIFYEENWAMAREQHPELNHRKLFGLLAKKYKMLSDEEKVQYVEKSQLVTQEYKKRKLELKNQWCKPRTSQQREEVSVDTSENQHCAEDAEGLPPKPPLNGYMLFCKEQRSSMAGVSSYVSEWAQRWRDLTKTQRNEYNIHCRKLRREYEVKLNEYLKGFAKEEQQQILSENGIKRFKGRKSINRKVKILQQLPGEPKMPSRCGNIIFFKNQMELLKEKFPNAKERFTKVSQMWQVLSQREKEYYKEKVHENFEKYSTELQNWFKTLTAAQQKEYRKCNPRKCRYLEAPTLKEEPYLYKPSDSEDEDIEISSSDEEDNMDSNEDEEEEENGDITFEMY
ncbi:nucleolar transcription factor 1-like isoform X2 [Mastacembelus armatus]|uniref:nucleolar transcription factor 1-like isoform X2 n=1 Tax=Mastacembelus armatus TaxID=205130 RepID=UPI000E456F90|nr:nucleolar transcription factor 1-like isoform X2 [Mastacembelus armatus]